ncbi:MAG: hypothetical protein HKN39_04480 [Flavobacteriales bacterium]|nr:hypothetical protein [Flavobacteriales bacterium]
MFEQNLKLYDEFVSKCPKFERKGKTVPYTSANGYMFSLLNKEGELGIRFSKEVQEKYVEKYKTSLFKSHNSVMRGYILITDKMLKDKKNMVRLLNESYDHIMTLEPK